MCFFFDFHLFVILPDQRWALDIALPLPAIGACIIALPANVEVFLAIFDFMVQNILNLKYPKQNKSDELLHGNKTL